jgi:hypothetical protein
MEKTGLCSSGGQGSQCSTAGMAQHTTNPAEKQNHDELLQTSHRVSVSVIVGSWKRFRLSSLTVIFCHDQLETT